MVILNRWVPLLIAAMLVCSGCGSEGSTSSSAPGSAAATTGATATPTLSNTVAPPSAASALRIVAIGDSIPHASFCPECDGFLEQYERGLEARLARPVDVSTGYCDNVAWSPDGTRLAFTRLKMTEGVEGPSASEIQVLTLATGAVTTALERPLLADVARWSPDGSQLVIQVDRMDEEANETGAAIAIVDAAGGEPRYLVDLEAFAGNADWSWETGEIVYEVGLLDLQRTPPDDTIVFDLFAIQRDGGGARQVTHLVNGARLLAPRWTHDGLSILAKQFDHDAGGGRLVDAVTGLVEPFVTGLDETRPLIRPGAARS